MEYKKLKNTGMFFILFLALIISFNTVQASNINASLEYDYGHSGDILLGEKTQVDFEILALPEVSELNKVVLEVDGNEVNSWASDFISDSVNNYLYSQSDVEITEEDYGSTGKHEITLYAELGNGDYDKSSLTLDVTENNPPEITIDSPNEGELFGKKDITVDFSVSDESELDNCEYKLNSQSKEKVDCSGSFSITASEGSNTLTIYATDVFDNSNSESVSFSVELNNPPTIENIPGQSITQGQSFSSFDLDNYAYDEEDPQDSLTYSYSGNNQINVSINQYSQVSLDYPDSWTGQENIQFTVEDSEGATDSTTASFEVTEPVNNPPEITSSPITEINENSSYEYQVQAEDKDDDNDDLTYSLEQSPSWLSISSSGLISGNSPEVSQDTDYTIEVSVSDGKDSDTQTYTLIVKEIVPPKVEINSPSEGKTFTTKNIQVEYNVTEGDKEINSCEYELNSQGKKNLDCSEGINTFILDSNELDEGNNDLTVYVSDTQGTEVSDSVSFNVDTTPPEITVVYPNESQKYYGFIKFVIETDENATAKYSLDNSENVSMSDAHNVIFNSNLFDISQGDISVGNHDVTFYAEDDFGNSNQKTVEFEMRPEDEEVSGNLPTNLLRIDFFRKPNKTTLNYYGSGDYMGDGDIDSSDANRMPEENVKVPNPGWEKVCDGDPRDCLVLMGERNLSLERADVNGDGWITEEDREMIWEYYYEDDSIWSGGDTTDYLPSHWYKLNREEKISWLNKSLNITKAREYIVWLSFFNKTYRPMCGNYAKQFVINYRGLEGQTHPNKTEDDLYYPYNLYYNQRFNIPLHFVTTEAEGGAGHAINGIYVGPKSGKPSDRVVTNFSNWYFIEPQTLERVRPGDGKGVGEGSIGENAYVRIGSEIVDLTLPGTIYFNFENGEAFLKDWYGKYVMRLSPNSDNNKPFINLSQDLDGKQLSNDEVISLDYNIEEGEFIYREEGYAVFNESFLDKCWYNFNGKKENIPCYEYIKIGHVNASDYNYSGTLNLEQTEGTNKLIIHVKDVAGNFRKKVIEWELETDEGQRVIAFGDESTKSSNIESTKKTNKDITNDLNNKESQDYDGSSDKGGENQRYSDSGDYDDIGEGYESYNDGFNRDESTSENSIKKLKRKIIKSNSDTLDTDSADGRNFFIKFIEFLARLFGIN